MIELKNNPSAGTLVATPLSKNTTLHKIIVRINKAVIATTFTFSMFFIPIKIQIIITYNSFYIKLLRFAKVS